MSIANLLAGLVVGGAKAASAYKVAAEKKKPTQTVTQTPTYNNKSVYDNIYGSTNGDIGTALNNALNTNASVDTVKKIYQDRLSKATGTQYENDSIMKNALNYINQNQQINPYAAQLEQNQAQYDALLKDYKNVMNASVKQGTQNLESQKSGINQSADDMARQAYITNRQSANNLPQQLASQGITGGGTETAQLSLMSNYENNLNDINTNRNNALNAVDTSINDLKNQGELDYAQQTLANNQAALAAYQNMLNNSASYNQWQTEYNAGRDDNSNAQQYQNKLFDYNVGRDAVNDQRYASETATAQQQQEYNNILNRLGMGLISANDAVNLGVPLSDVQAYANRINAMNDLELQAMKADLANTYSTIANRGKTSTKSPVTVESTALAYLNKGDREHAISALMAKYSEAETKAFLEQYGFNTKDIQWNIPLESQGTSFVPSTPDSPTTMLVKYLSGLGLTSQQIADRLNK